MKGINMDTNKNDGVVMPKPIGLMRKELQSAIINDINNSQLPLFVVGYIVENILSNIKEAVEMQDSKEEAEYYNSTKGKEDGEHNE